MKVEEARAQYYEGRNLNAGIVYVKALEAEIERLRELITTPDSHLQYLRKTQDRAEKADAELKSFKSHVYDNIAAQHKAEARVKELEGAITKIIDCVAKVSVDIFHPEPGESWFEKKQEANHARTT